VSEATLTRERPAALASPRVATGWLRSPWRKPRFLQAVTWSYLLWSTLPVVIAIIFSFNAGRSRSTWQGFSLRWWYQDPFDSLWNDPALRTAMFQTLRLSIVTMVVSVPLGTAFAIGIDRWRGRPAATANFFMLFSFVMPEIILGVSLFLLFANLFEGIVQLGTTAQILGLVTFQISYPVIVVRARLLSIGPEFEEAAMDLGASPTQALRRVLLPLLGPAILASAALVFADSVDNFVTVGEDLLGRPILADAGGERGRDRDARDDARGHRARVVPLPSDQRGSGRGHVGGGPRRALSGGLTRPPRPPSQPTPARPCRSASGALRPADGRRPGAPGRMAGPRPGSAPTPGASARARGGR